VMLEVKAPVPVPLMVTDPETVGLAEVP